MPIGSLNIKRKAIELYNDPKHARIIQWGKLISITGSAQILVQTLALVSGILIIRLLPTKEYAFYTLVNTMLGTMGVLADSGVGDGVLSQGGKVWQDSTKLGSVIATGLDLRKKFAIASLVLILPILVYMLLNHGASIMMALLLSLCLIPSFLVALSASILEMAPKLHQDILPLQKNQIGLNIGRLVLVSLTLFLFPFAYIAISAASLPQIWANLRLRKISAAYADRNQEADPIVRAEIMKIVRRTMPGAVYFCFSSQITTWLISIFGTTDNLAQVGALGRLAVILNVFTAMFSTLVIPRFARLVNDKKLLIYRFLQIQFSLVILSLTIISIVILFPHPVLSILGKNYAMLSKEVVIVIIGSCLSMMAGITYNILLSRAWVMHPAIMIGVNIITQVILMLSLNLTKMQSVLWFSVINSMVSLVMLQLFYFYKINSKRVAEN